jgi:glycosyltransferase involved in cell wall biosynthesis
LANEQRHYPLLNALLTHLLDFVYYKRIFRSVDFFLARSGLVKKSLIEDYGISEKKIEVTYLPSNIIQNTPSKINEKLSLLFVGNNWFLKGGPFLLDIFDEKISEIAKLTIISTDKEVLNIPRINGLSVVNGMPNRELLSVMYDSDIFLFPSWKDELGLVLCEAVSQGLAVFARKSGAQDEIVVPLKNGFLFQYNSTPEQWREKLRHLHSHTVELYQMKENSLSLAREKLSGHTFKKKILRTVLDQGLH